MQTSSRLLDDFAKVASGAVSTAVGLKQEIDALVRQRIERLVSQFDLVRRDEFEAVKAMASEARAAQEALEQRLAQLQQQLAAATGEAAETVASGGGDATPQRPPRTRRR
jgi:BMFP domain-containing protein YqiC